MRRGLVCLLAVLSSLAIACQVQVETVVQDDGAASQSVRIGFSKELLASFGANPDDLASEMESNAGGSPLANLPQGVSYSLINDDKQVGVELRFEVGPSDDVAAAFDALMGSLPPDVGDLGFVGGGSDAEYVLRRDGEGWVFHQSSPGIDPSELGSMLGGQGDQNLAGAAALFASQIQVSYRLHLPGKVVSDNADEVESDGTLVWNLEGPEVLSGFTMDARSEPGGGGVSAALIVGILVVAGAVAALGYAYYRRRTAAL